MSRTTIVVDLGFGDAGKGSIVDYLARKDGATAVVRYNGGAQAGHNVHTPDGRHHTFNQFGSGTFVPGVVTHLSRFMLVSPLNLFQEAERLRKVGVDDALARITIDEDAKIVTPYHRAANRIREIARAKDRHGSCGEGIGETVADSIDHPELVLRARDLRDQHLTARLLEEIRRHKFLQLQNEMQYLNNIPAATLPIDTLTDRQLKQDVLDLYTAFTRLVRIVDSSYLGKLLATHEHVVFEGAQGVLLDEWYGFHPYTTWSTTTAANARQLLAEAGYNGKVKTLGLLRAYSVRHGAGPFVTEDTDLTAALPDTANGFNDWQGDFRVGYFDLVAARYALDVVVGVDALAITCLDRLYGIDHLQTCDSYMHGDRIITRLPVKADLTDLGSQEELTHRLEQSQPLLLTFQDRTFRPDDIEQYIDHIEELEIPVEVISVGPTARGKAGWRSPLRKAS